MAGVSVQAFRRQGRRFGAGLVCSEMVSCAGIEHRNEKTLGYLRVARRRAPARDPALRLRAADDGRRGAHGRGRRRRHRRRQLRLPREEGDEDRRGRAPARGSGSRLPRSSRRSRTRSTSRSSSSSGAACGRLARLPRARAAARRGGRGVADAPPALGAADVHRNADHSLTAELVSLVDVPVVASGDVTSRARAQAVLATTGAEAVMVGRGAQGNPWALREIVDGDAAEPSREEVAAELVLFVRETVRELGERRASGFLKKFYGWYLGRGRFPKEFKQELLQLDSTEEVERRLLAAAPGALRARGAAGERGPVRSRGDARAAGLDLRRRLSWTATSRGVSRSRSARTRAARARSCASATSPRR